MDRTSFLANPAFWGMYYYDVLGPQPCDVSEGADPVFGPSYAQISGLYSDYFVADDPPWPYIHVPVTDAYGITIEFGDDGVRYSLDLHQSQRLTLGQTGAAPELPAFRWSEIERISDSLKPAAKNPVSQAACLLLLFQATYLTPDDDPLRAEGRLTSAWGQTGIAEGPAIRALAARTMMAARSSVRWRNDPALGWVNDGEYSRRNPHQGVKPYSAAQFAFIQRFFHSIGSD